MDVAFCLLKLIRIDTEPLNFPITAVNRHLHPLLDAPHHGVGDDGCLLGRFRILTVHVLNLINQISRLLPNRLISDQSLTFPRLQN